SRWLCASLPNESVYPFTSTRRAGYRLRVAATLLTFARPWGARVASSNAKGGPARGSSFVIGGGRARRGRRVAHPFSATRASTPPAVSLISRLIGSPSRGPVASPLPSTTADRQAGGGKHVAYTTRLVGERRRGAASDGRCPVGPGEGGSVAADPYCSTITGVPTLIRPQTLTTSSFRMPTHPWLTACPRTSVFEVP